MFWFFVLIFLFGLCVGSFLNVLIYRLPHCLPITGRSFCPKCKKKIAWYDNLPLLSFILLGGRCRLCHSPIGWSYPIVEFLTGIMFVLTVILPPDQNIKYQILNSKYFLDLSFYLILISALIVVFFIDLKHQIIPDQVIYPAIIVTAFYQLILNCQLPIIWQSQILLCRTNYLITALLSALFFLLLHLLTRGRGMGFGDVKLAFLIGLVLGFPQAVLAFYLAFLTGALVGVILILIRVKKFGQTVPFGPFLVVGALTSLFTGQEILKWMSRFF